MPFPLLASPFVSLAWGFVKRFWPYILVGLLILGAYLYVQGLRNEIVDLNKELERKEQVITGLNLKIQTCEANFAGVKGSLDAQNAALGKVEQLVKKNEVEWKKLTDSLKNENAALAKRLEGILKEKKPQTCEEAIKYLLDARKGYTK